MKNVLVILFMVMSIFSLVACHQSPPQSNSTISSNQVTHGAEKVSANKDHAHSGGH